MESDTNRTKQLINTARIDGSCHCGNIRFDLQWPEDEREIAVRMCGCSFCKKHGGAWTSNHSSSLVVSITDPTRVSKYNFGTKTADFYVCTVCGIVPFVLSSIDNNQYAVVNVNTFVNVKDYKLSTASTDFDAEETVIRLARRKRNWIPSVFFNDSATNTEFQ